MGDADVRYVLIEVDGVWFVLAVTVGAGGRVRIRVVSSDASLPPPSVELRRKIEQAASRAANDPAIKAAARLSEDVVGPQVGKCADSVWTALVSGPPGGVDGVVAGALDYVQGLPRVAVEQAVQLFAPFCGPVPASVFDVAAAAIPLPWDKSLARAATSLRIICFVFGVATGNPALVSIFGHALAHTAFSRLVAVALHRAIASAFGLTTGEPVPASPVGITPTGPTPPTTRPLMSSAAASLAVILALTRALDSLDQKALAAALEQLGDLPAAQQDSTRAAFAKVYGEPLEQLVKAMDTAAEVLERLTRALDSLDQKALAAALGQLGDLPAAQQDPIRAAFAKVYGEPLEQLVKAMDTAVDDTSAQDAQPLESEPAPGPELPAGRPFGPSRSPSASQVAAGLFREPGPDQPAIRRGAGPNAEATGVSPGAPGSSGLDQG